MLKVEGKSVKADIINMFKVLIDEQMRISRQRNY